MTALLHIDASARRRSFSREVGDAFAAAWRAAHPGAGYTHRDLARDPVPQIGEAWTEICDGIMAAGLTDTARYPEAVRTPPRRRRGRWSSRCCPSWSPRTSCSSPRRCTTSPSRPR
ncbi:NAD(P)H-dependent oxidoreductase [Nocardiopsis composta]